MKTLYRYGVVLGVAWVLVCLPASVRAEEGIVKIDEPSQAAGELFGVPVSMDNYRFAKAAASIFSGRGGRDVSTLEDLEERTWEDLLLSYEAYRRQVAVPQEKLEEELDKLLKAEKVTFDRKKDKAAYEKWTQDTVHVPATLFENMLKHLMQLQMLRDQVRESFDPPVTDDEAKQKYINEYNTLELELVQFDDEATARAFYEKMKSPKQWDKKGKKDPKFSKKTGFVSFEWLIDAWKIPKKDCYAMLDLPENSVYPPTPIYKGYAVFRTIKKRAADPAEFPAKREEYLKRVKSVKQYQELNKWFEQLKKDANIKRFAPGPA
jgi:hypothetical protein